MAKRSNQKLKLLYLLKILFEQTDEHCGLTISQISAELAKYNVSAERKSLYDDVEALRLFGVDVCVKRDRYVRYYIAKRDISSSELRYILDAIADFDALSPSGRYELLQKLVKLYGTKGRTYSGSINEPSYKTPPVLSRELDASLEALDSAIVQGRKIFCRIFTWNSVKQRTVLHGGKKLCLTPIRISCEGKYLLYAYDGNSVSAYDVSEMLDVEMSQERAAPLDEYKTLLNELEDSFEYENIRLEVSNSFSGEIFRKFGLGVTVLSSREDTFELSVKVRLDDGLFAWLFTNAKHVRIVSPDRVRNAYKERLILAIQNADIK